jgi:hypothetical protein
VSVSLASAGAAPSHVSDVVALHEALLSQARMDERRSRLVELRYFGGLTAEVLVSPPYRTSGVGSFPSVAVSRIAPDRIGAQQFAAQRLCSGRLSGRRRMSSSPLGAEIAARSKIGGDGKTWIRTGAVEAPTPVLLHRPVRIPNRNRGVFAERRFVSPRTAATQ